MNFVIFGQARTGSNLLRQLLQSHPQLECRGEVYFRRNWLGRRRPYLQLVGLPMHWLVD
jgi:LPS sulfotransferase NodH